jgi:hypothetical protein
MKLSLAIFLAVPVALAASCEAEQATPQNSVSAVTGAAAADANGSVSDAEAAEVDLRLASGGLLATQTSSTPGRTLAFGMPREEAVGAVASILGPATGEGSNEECGAGPMQFTSFGTLSLNFQQGAFVGWSLRGPPRTPALRSAAGLGIGTPRDQIMGEGQGPLQVSETSLGTQFDAAGILGLLSGPEPDATVTSIWAGTNCIFH